MEMKSNILVIHPSDSTTDCLKVIYEGRGFDVINDIHTSDKEVREAISTHEEIWLLGHGGPEGLLCGNGIIRFARFIINESHIPLLEDKKTFSIWCNSDEFFRKIKGKGGKGFHSKMVISEVGEEYAVLGYAPLNEFQMNRNIQHYCNLFAKYIDVEYPEEMIKNILAEYNGTDAVTEFNRKSFLIL